MNSEDLTFPSPQELEQLILQKGGASRAREILKEITTEMTISPGEDGTRYIHRFKKTDGRVIREAVLATVRKHWEARLTTDEDTQGHILLIIGPRRTQE